VIKAKAKVYGPFEVLNLNELGEGTPLVTIPYAEVVGSQILAAITENFEAGALSFTGDAQFYLAFEVSFWGSYQGFQSCLKRTTMRALTGPTSYYFDGDAAFDQVIVKARNMSGGRRGPGINGVVTNANGYSASLNLFIQPRSGFNKD
jgi:hypothetical protein